MELTDKLGLKKPHPILDYVLISDINDNMDVLDEAVGELKEGSTVIEELETTNKTLSGAINEIEKKRKSHLAENVTSHNVSRGTSSFVGSNQEATIPHGLIGKPTSAYAFPTVNPEGYLGEVWIRMDATNLYIGNSGSFTGIMSWVAIG